MWGLMYVHIICETVQLHLVECIIETGVASISMTAFILHKLHYLIHHNVKTSVCVIDMSRGQMCGVCMHVRAHGCC